MCCVAGGQTCEVLLSRDNGGASILVPVYGTADGLVVGDSVSEQLHTRATASRCHGPIITVVIVMGRSSPLSWADHHRCHGPFITIVVDRSSLCGLMLCPLPRFRYPDEADFPKNATGASAVLVIRSVASRGFRQLQVDVTDSRTQQHRSFCVDYDDGSGLVRFM